LFVLLYLAGKLLVPNLRVIELPKGIPSRKAVLLYIAVAAALGFFVRTVFPIGREVFSLPIGSFPMYVILFAAGIKAGREQWFDTIASLPVGLWTGLAGLGFALFPVLGIAPGQTPDPSRFFGGLTWQSAAYALWEAGTGTCVFIVTLVIFARTRWVVPGIGESFGGSSYGIYLLHAFVVILLALGIRNLAIHPAFKWMTLSVCGVCLPWAATGALRKLPGFSRIL